MYWDLTNLWGNLKELWVDKKDLNKKCRLFRSTKPKIDKEKNKKKRKIAKKSKRINRGNKR